MNYDIWLKVVVLAGWSTHTPTPLVVFATPLRRPAVLWHWKTVWITVRFWLGPCWSELVLPWTWSLWSTVPGRRSCVGCTLICQDWTRSTGIIESYSTSSYAVHSNKVCILYPLLHELGLSKKIWVKFWSYRLATLFNRGITAAAAAAATTTTTWGAITSKIKHAIKLTTSPARLAQPLQPSLAFCFSLQPMTAYRPVRRHWLQVQATVVQVLQDLF